MRRLRRECSRAPVDVSARAASALARTLAPLAPLALLAAGCGEAEGPCEAGEPGVICPLAGTGGRAFNGDGHTAFDTDFYLLSAVEPSPDGVMHIVDFNNQRIRTIADDGTVTTVVGSGVHFFAATGGPALDSPLENPLDMEFDRDGRLVFVSLHDPRVLYVDDDGILHALAGTGDQGDTGDGGDATRAQFLELGGVAIGPDGAVYVADALANKVRVVRPDGVIEAVAGTGEAGYAGDGGPAAAAQLDYPTALAVDPAGRLYVADSRNHAVRRVDPDGTITTVAGTGEAGFSGDGGPATDARLDTPEGLAIADDGALIVSDWENDRIRRIGPDGVIATIAGTGEDGPLGDGGPAVAATLAGPARLSVRDGALYVADQLNSCARVVYLP